MPAVDGLVWPEGDTGKGVDDDTVGGVAWTVLPVMGPASRLPDAPRSHAAKARPASTSSADREAGDRSRVMHPAWQRGCPTREVRSALNG